MRDLLLLAFAMGTIAHGRDLPPLTYETRATSAQAVAKDIGKALGVPLSVAPELAREVMVVRMKDVPGDAALRKLAEALKAELIQADQGWRIQRSPTLRESQVQEDHVKLAAILQTWLDKNKKDRRQGFEGEPAEAAGSTQDAGGVSSGGPPPENPEEAAQRKQFQEAYQRFRESSEKLWDAVGEMISGDTLASIGVGNRLVYSTSPTSNQTKVNNGVTTLFREFNAEMAKIGAKYAKDAENWFGSNFRPLKRLLIRVDRNRPFVWTVLAQGYDAEGNPGATFRMSPTALDQNVLMALFDGEQKPTEVKTKIALRNPKAVVPPNEAFKTLGAFVNAISQGSPPPMVDLKDMLAFFRRPVSNEPLSKTPTSTLFLLADDQRSNLAAVLGDEAFALEGAAIYNREVSLQMAIAYWEQFSTAEFEVKDGWVLLKPAMPSLSQLCRMDRAALQSLIEKEENGSGISILDKGTFFLTYPEYSEGLWQMYSYLAVPGLSSGWDGSEDAPDAYRFFATLGGNLREALWQGQAIPYSQLTPDARRHFERCLDQVEDVTGENSNLNSWMFGNAEGQKIEVRPPFQDITDLSSATISQSRVSASVYGDVVVRPTGDVFNFYMLTTMSPETLAMMLQMQNDPEAASYTSMMPKFDRFQPGERTRLDLKFAVTPQFGGRKLINGIKMTGDKRGVEFRDLPPPFIAAVRKAEEAYRKMMEGYQPGPEESGGGIKP